MNFKLFMPLTAFALIAASCQNDDLMGSTKGSGTISPEFTIDYSVSNPRTESRATEQASVAPSLEEFSFRLVKDDGKFEKSVTGLGQFAGMEIPVGAYSLEATYGDVDNEGIDAAYFYGNATFSVYDGEEATPALVAKLANTAVSVEYTEAFKNYFTEYSTQIHSSNSATYIDMANDETGWAYVKPGDISVTLNVTKQNGVSGQVEALKITNAAVGTHYHVVVDANGGEVGNESILVSFDATTEVEEIEIPVDVLVTPAPVITPAGFTSGTAIDILEGDEAEGTLKVSILAEGGLQNVILSSSTATEAMSALAGDVDLMTATDAQKAALQAVEIECLGLWNNPDKMAVIDLTKMLKYLSAAGGQSSTHTFSIKVVDKLNKTCDPVVLTVNAPKPVLTISNPAELHFGDATASFDFYYNGKDLENKVVFQVNNAMGVLVNTTIASANPIGDNLYRVTINIPDSDDDLRVMATYNNTNSDVVTIKRIVSVVANDYDVWATSASLTIAPASIKSKVTSITLNGATRSESFDSYGKCTFTGLAAATTYNAVVTLENGDAYPVEFITEAATQVPNGNFEDLTQTASVTEMLMGGQYKVSPATYTPWCSFTVSEPTGWSSINNLTCNTNAATLNTWFVIPSTYATNISATAHCPGAAIAGSATETPSVYANLTAQSGSAAVVVRNVAWDSNGTNPSTSGGAFNTTYYCENIPTIANRSAGQLSLDTTFSVRPMSLQGYYKYTRDSQDNSENAVVTVTMLNGSTEIAKGSVELGAASDYTQFTVPITYSVKNLKATNLKIMITSSNRAEGSIKTTNYLGKLQAWSYGAQLTVDNLTFTY